MKTKLTAEATPVQLPLTKAANDDVCAPPAITLSEPVAWDPFDVWRTRILPYQRQRRALADKTAKR